MYALPAPAIPSLAVASSAARVPVRRVWCVGRNYRKHAVEMGGDPDREPPFFFAKPADAVVDARPGAAAVVPYPPQTRDLHHEVELAVIIGRGGRDLSPEHALDHVFGYAVAIDLTRRDLQAEAKQTRRPWALAKGFDASAPIAAVVPVSQCGHPHAGRIWLTVDGETRQDADLAEMIWKVPEVLAHLSRSVRVEPGDVVLTGTPAGVGPLQVGQRIEAGIADWTRLTVDIGPA